jgi:hypothetical protein
MPTRVPSLLFVALATLACGGEPSGPGADNGTGFPDPGPGPHLSVLPVPIETIARITALGYNNNVFPTPHTYWLTCDVDVWLNSARPCHLERQAIRAPRDGVILDMLAAPDGFMRIEGPRGLVWTFGHVTPAAGLAIGSQVTAGQAIATMFVEHGFDFGLTNYGVDRQYVVQERYNHGYLYGEHPIAQFPEPLRSQLAGRVQTIGADPLGSLDFDVPGTAAGGWFLPGVPQQNSLQIGHDHLWLWLGRFTERPATRIAGFGDLWTGMQNRILAVDDDAPNWDAITPASGTVAVKLWNLAASAEPNHTWPAGTLLLEMPDAMHLRMQWFATHDPVPGFTAAARLYSR